MERYYKQLSLFTEREIKKREAKIEKLKQEIQYYQDKLNELLPETINWAGENIKLK